MPRKSSKAEGDVKTEVSQKPQEPGKLAVIELSGHQFLVHEGNEFEIDNQDIEVGKKITVSEVLLLEDEGKVSVGQPYVTGSVVELEVLENKKGEKIEVIKYKAKSRYRKHVGYRSSLTKVKVVSIK
jgi:large subunit ribosomal protein L21